MLVEAEKTPLGECAGMSLERNWLRGAATRYYFGGMTDLDDPRFSTCFVCNEPMAPPKVRPGIAWVDDRTAEGDVYLWAVFAHQHCLRRVAHPKFDLDRSAATLEE